MSLFTSLLTALRAGWQHATHAIASWGQYVDRQVGPFEVACLIVATVALLAWVLVSLGAGSERELEEALQPFQVKPRLAAEEADEARFSLSALRHVSTLLAGFAERRGFRTILAERLETTGLPLGVGEFLTVWVVSAAVLLALGGLVGKLLGIFVALLIIVLVPLSLLKLLSERRKRLFASQIPDVLKLLASSLRAGFSLLQGLDAILYQVDDPMASELRRAFAATRVGTPVEDALEAAAERVGSRDFSWTVTAIRIQREVGGNLAEILDTVARTMTEREHLRREVHALTAEGRMSAIIVGALPFALAGLISVVNRPYIAKLFTTNSGRLGLLAGFMLELVGVWWLNKIVQIEI